MPNPNKPDRQPQEGIVWHKDGTRSVSEKLKRRQQESATPLRKPPRNVNR